MTRETLTLTVALRIPDNEARSALEAIRVKMGLANRVRDLVREEVWELTVRSDPGPARGSEASGTGSGDPGTGSEASGIRSDPPADASGSARAAIERIVETTNLFANPNKHRYALSRGHAADCALAPDEVAILVSDRESARGDSMVEAVRRLGVGALSGARRWVRWRLFLSEPPSREDPGLLPLIQRVAVAAAREGGLLCNPHIQEARAILPWGDENLLVR